MTGCGGRETKPRFSEVERLPRVEVVTPIRTILRRRIELAATIEPMEKVDLCARVPGIVGYLPEDIDIGRVVKGPREGMPGEKLVALDIPDLEAQKKHKEALLEQAHKQKVQAEEARIVGEREVTEAEKQEKRFTAELAFARVQHERMTELVKTKAVQPERAQESEKQLEAAAAGAEAAKAQIDTRRAKLRSLDADIETAKAKVQVADAEVHNLSVLIGYATLTAPFDGVVTKRWVDRGATIKDAGAPLLTVMRIDTVRVLLDVPEKDVPLVDALESRPDPNKTGDPVTLRVPALVGIVGDGVFTGRIQRMAQALDPNTRTMRAEVHLKNPNGHLRPGMFGRASILLDTRYDVLTLPATALQQGSGRPVIYYLANGNGDPPRGIVQRAEVELGLDDGQLIEVKFPPRSGLTGEEYILAKGNGVVRVGDEVFVVPVKKE
jgi:RND family efflux transporter MFP subunit